MCSNKCKTHSLFLIQTKLYFLRSKPKCGGDGRAKNCTVFLIEMSWHERVFMSHVITNFDSAYRLQNETLLVCISHFVKGECSKLVPTWDKIPNKKEETLAISR
uniref:Uncharacterized protein n=1 Tax=Cacopsylla melanoneura TaxID=428564 RepID=A0A8D8Z612_9HEMI